MTEQNLRLVAQELFRLLPVFHRKLIRSCWVQSKSVLSPMQLHVLFILQSKVANTMTEIAQEIGISRQQLTPLIDKLIASGHIQREHDQIDRRNIKLSITASGQQHLDNHRQVNIELLETKLRCLTDTDLQALDTAVLDLHQLLNKLP